MVLTLLFYMSDQRRQIVQVWTIYLALVVILVLVASAPARAQLTFPGASPLSAGNLTILEQPTLTDESNIQRIVGQSVLLYGASPNLALITESNLFVNTMANVVSGGKTVRLMASGIGDTTQEARYTIYQLDGIASTFRLAPLVGVTIPTGMDDANPQMPRSGQPGMGDFGGRAAMTSSWQTLYWNAEAEIGYDTYAPGAGYQLGNQFVADAAFHYVIWPRSLTANVSGELFASLESNYFVTQNSRMGGQGVPATGGQLWLVDPGLDYSTPHYGFALTALLPVQQTDNGVGSRNGLGSRYDFGVELHFRWSFYTSHHW